MADGDPIPIVYVDSDVLLSYVQNDLGRGPLILSILDDSSKKAIRIITSVMTMVEVKYGGEEKKKAQIDPAVQAKMNQIWAANGPVEPVEVTELVARDAMKLNRLDIARNQGGLSACDVIHLITAKRFRTPEGAKVTHFFTYSGDMKRYAKEMGFPISEPYRLVKDAPPKDLFDTTNETPKTTTEEVGAEAGNAESGGAGGLDGSNAPRAPEEEAGRGVATAATEAGEAEEEQYDENDGVRIEEHSSDEPLPANKPVAVVGLGESTGPEVKPDPKAPEDKGGPSAHGDVNKVAADPNPPKAL